MYWHVLRVRRIPTYRLYGVYDKLIRSARKQLLSKCYSNVPVTVPDLQTISVKSIRWLMVSLAPVIRSNAHRTWSVRHARHYPEQRGGNCLPCLIASYALDFVSFRAACVSKITVEITTCHTLMKETEYNGGRYGRDVTCKRSI